jgi:hypothetical protein
MFWIRNNIIGRRMTVCKEVNKLHECELKRLLLVNRWIENIIEAGVYAMKL